MNPPTLPHKNPNYYPNMAMRLSAAAEEMPAKSAAVLIPAGIDVVWGPAYLPVKGGDFTYSLMFIGHDFATHEYWISIRGTNPISPKSWFEEDFHVDRTKPFKDFVAGLDDDIQISDASYKGLQDLLSLVDPTTQETAISFLVSAAPKFLYVTGHSLGGTLVPPLFAILKAGVGAKATMACWSFAGLTTGNQQFADYINGLIPWDGWRIVNSLDIVPFLFWNKDGMVNIYNGDPKWSDFDAILTIIAHLFSAAKKHDYTQPGGYFSMTGTKVPGKNFVGEFLDQHAHQTYLNLVAANFPV